MSELEILSDEDIANFLCNLDNLVDELCVGGADKFRFDETVITYGLNCQDAIRVTAAHRRQA